ncbi:hypothetical protein B0O99DRAFT_684301 [Bisporella sp. PMI_857]|nr:hypothetical protein B0O99DRAFT_684301 [Bisporella sp. PMI_857]
MRAIDLKVAINQVPIPEPRGNEFRVKITPVLLCHNDPMSTGEIFAGAGGILGHEGAGAGYVFKLHPSTEGNGHKFGDAVGFLYTIRCCLSVKAAWFITTIVYGRRAGLRDSRSMGSSLSMHWWIIIARLRCRRLWA